MDVENTILAIIALTLIANTLGVNGIYFELLFVFFGIALLAFVFLEILSEIGEWAA